MAEGKWISDLTATTGIASNSTRVEYRSTSAGCLSIGPSFLRGVLDASLTQG